MCSKASATFPNRTTNLTSVFLPNQSSLDAGNDNGTCYTNNHSYIMETNGPSFVLQTSRLEIGGTYVIMLIVKKGKRASSLQQMVEIVAGEPPSIEIM